MKLKIITLMLIVTLLTVSGCSGILSEAGTAVEAIIGEDNSITPSTTDNHQDETSSTLVDSSDKEEVSYESVLTDLENLEQTEIHESTDDYIWENDDVVSVQISDEGIEALSEGITVDGNKVIISKSGNYQLSGKLSDGQVTVDTEDDGIIRLVLDNLSIYNSSGPALYIQKAEKVLIFLSAGSENFLSDGSNYFLPDADSDEPNATIFSTADLTLDGAGILTIAANYNDGIASKDGLIINGGNISVNALDDGIRGKDYIVIRNASLYITANGDGIKSDESEDTGKGFITIETGTVTIQAGSDAIEAETIVSILAGDFDLVSGGGSGNWLNSTTSAKGIKGGNAVLIENGSFIIDSSDDCLHSNNSITINSGTFSLTSGDDGIHADTELTINAGQIAINQSYEGLESAIITINAGDIQIISSDDGINLAGGVDSSGMNAAMPGGGRPGRDSGRGGDTFNQSGDYALYINGGEVDVNASGDGIDSNGSIEMTNGSVMINGPVENMNSALDYLGHFTISGGVLLAVGSAGMAQAPDTSSSQPSVIVFFNGNINRGTSIELQASSGETIFTFSPAKTIQSLVFSTPALEIGAAYTLFVAGSEYGSFDITSEVTQIGSGGMFQR
jgi:hypothetical protein